MKIAIVGKFGKLHDEEYIARSFESLGHTVLRVEQKHSPRYMVATIIDNKTELVIFSKINPVESPKACIDFLRKNHIKTASWIFDLYWGYPREHNMMANIFFKVEKVFTTDGGHEDEWRMVGVDHQVVRQGIYKPECYIEPPADPHGVVFVGSDNPLFRERTRTVLRVRGMCSDFRWIGKRNSDEVRGTDLNKLYASAKVVIGDSVYSPHYWSNRVVETLGRGGFLIHQEVPGIKEEYPDLVTYQRGDMDDLNKKINYYLNNEEERLEIIRKNYEHVRDNYTTDKKCAELLSKL